MIVVFRYNELFVRSLELTAGLPGHILQNSLAWNSFSLSRCDVFPDYLTILIDNEHRGCSLAIREEIVHPKLVGNYVIAIGQDGKLRIGRFNGARSSTL